MSAVSIYPVAGLPEIVKGASLPDLIGDALARLGMSLEEGDVVVITQKVVSKAEGRVVSLDRVHPSVRATEIGQRIGFDPRHVEVILSESVRIVREAPRVLITETRHGFICANSGVDRSNTGGKELVVLLPEHPDESARRLRAGLQALSDVEVGVVSRGATSPRGEAAGKQVRHVRIPQRGGHVHHRAQKVLRRCRPFSHPAR